MTETLLQIQNLRKSFGSLDVLKGITTDIRKGEVDPAIKEQIDRKHKVSRFKFQTLPVYQNGLPIVLPEETDYYNPNKK